jgi:hypothetical protein
MLPSKATSADITEDSNDVGGIETEDEFAEFYRRRASYASSSASLFGMLLCNCKGWSHKCVERRVDFALHHSSKGYQGAMMLHLRVMAK